MRAPRTTVNRRSESGFSLIELLIAMVIAVELLIAALTVFDVHNRMTQVQMQITEVQQSVRVAQYDLARTTRLAGRGGLPARFVPVDTGTTTYLASRAIEVRDNLIDDADREVARGFAGSPKAVPGTDILVVRGCISGPMYQIGIAPGDFDVDPTTPGIIDTGQLTISKSARGNRQQLLQQFLDPQFFDSSGTPHYSPLVLQDNSNRQNLVIVEVTGVVGDLDAVTLQLDFLPNDDVPNNPIITTPEPDLAIAYACVLEEYRYYVRENYSIPGDATSRPLPRLSRARMIPGTETPYRSDPANLSLDIADEIIDLQVALALDTDYDLDGATDPGAFVDDADTLGNDDVLYEGTTDDERATDDWLWNSSSDDPAEAQYVTNAFTPGAVPKLLFARITLVGRSARPDPSFDIPDFDPVVGEDWVENNDYEQAPANVWKTGDNRNHRRRILQTVVDMRNIS